MRAHKVKWGKGLDRTDHGSGGRRPIKLRICDDGVNSRKPSSQIRTFAPNFNNL